MSPIIHHRARSQQNKENKVENDVLETEKVVAVADNEKDKEKEEPAEVAEVKTDEPQTAETAAAAPASPEEGENAENAAEQPAPPKKDKVKKKWSFRSISFGKKDKQKPAKKEKKVDEEPAVVVEEAVKEDEAAATSSQSADKAEEVLEPAKVEAVVKSPEVVSKEPPKVEVTPVKEEEEIAPIPAAAAVVAAVEPTKEKEPEAEKVEIVEPAKPEVAPTMPTTPPPSQASVFAESLTTEPEETAEKPAIDIEPVAQMVEKVLEEAAESVEAELSEKSEEFPDPPADDNSEEATTETPAEINMNGKLDSPVDEVCWQKNLRRLSVDNFLIFMCLFFIRLIEYGKWRDEGIREDWRNHERGELNKLEEDLCSVCTLNNEYFFAFRRKLPRRSSTTHRKSHHQSSQNKIWALWMDTK